MLFSWHYRMKWVGEQFTENEAYNAYTAAWDSNLKDNKDLGRNTESKVFILRTEIADVSFAF